MTDIDRTPKPCLHPIAEHQHGTKSAYTWDGCRCHPCTASYAEHRRRITRAKLYGTWDCTTSDAEEVRVHLRQLMATGMDAAAVARCAGLSRTTVRYCLDGRSDKGRKPPVRIRNATARAILAVKGVPDDERISAVGSRRRLRALGWNGWSVTDIATRSGLSAHTLRKVASGDQISVLAGLARQVATTFDQMALKLAPNGAHYLRTRRRALALGWAPPLAWDEDAIDNPAVGPDLGVRADGMDENVIARLVSGERIQATIEERKEAALQLTAAGKSSQWIANQLKVTQRTVLRYRKAS